MRSTMRPLLSLFLVALFMVMCSPKEEADIMVDTIRLSSSTVSLVKGQKVTLEAEVLPLNSVNQNLSWYSTDNSVASVNNGTVVANELGEATITVKSGRVWANCLVRVVAQKIPVESIMSEQKELSLNVEEQIQLNYTLTPANTTDIVYWSSSDETVARVVGGMVFARATGTTVITATVGDKSICWTVRVVLPAPKVTKLVVSPATLEMEVEDVKLISAEVTADRPEDVIVAWSSDNSEVVTVLNGRLTAKKEGSATVTAKVGDFEGKCAVTVVKQSTEIKALRLNKTNTRLRVDEAITLVAYVLPEKALGILEWSSSNEEIATVSPYGYVKAKSEGQVQITVRAGAQTAVCNIEVVTGLSADDFNIEISDVTALDAIVTLMPPADDVTYIFDIYSKPLYEKIIMTSGGIIEHNLAFWKEFGDAQFYPELKTGVNKKSVAYESSGTFPGLTYVATSFGIDRNKNITSPLKVVEFKLNGNIPSSNKLSFKEKEITSTGISGEVVASNADGYYITLQTKKFVDFYKNKQANNPNELMEGLPPIEYMLFKCLTSELDKRTLEELILHGNTTITNDYFGAKRPRTDYVLIMVGLNKEQGLCTEPVYHYFTTKPRS